MNRASLFKSGLWTAYGATATRLLALLSNLLLARLLLPSEFGVISVAYIFWAFANLFTQGTAGSFLVYKGVEDKRYLDTTYTISLLIGLVLALGLLALSPLAANFFGVPDLVWILVFFAFNLLLSSAQSVYVGVLTRRMQYRELANSTLIASLIRVFCTTGCALLGFSYWSFAVGDTAYWLMAFALTNRHVKHNFRLHIDPEVKAEVLSYCLGATGFSFGFYINANCDNVVIGRLLGSTSLGYYSFAYQLTTALSTILIQAIGQVGMSYFAQLPDDIEREKALVKVVEQTSFLAAPVYALFFLVIDQQVISFLFGSKWIPACTVIPWLLIFAYFRLINSQLFCMLSAKGQPGVNAKINLFIAPLAVIGFVIGAWKGGILGVSIAVAIILGIVWTIYCWWVGCRELSWSLKKFLILCFKPPLIVLIPIFIALNVPTILKPFLFTCIYLVCVRIIAAKQFFRYQILLSSLVKKISHIAKSIWRKLRKSAT